MAAPDSFAQWLSQIQSGNDDAVREVFVRFSRRLIGLARKQFNAVLRNKVDPEDVVQSVYKSFFIRYGEGKLQVESWDNLWGLLTLFTLRKCADQAAYHQAARRDARREVPLEKGKDSEEGSLWAGIDREPTPVEAAMLSETVERLVRALDADARPILELSLQGFTTTEISAQLGKSERTVRRVREQVRKRLMRMDGEGA